jgi:hypothetical protein
MNYKSFDLVKTRKKKKNTNLKEDNVYNMNADQYKKDNVYFSDIYTSDLKKGEQKMQINKDINESNMSIVLESLNNPKPFKNKSTKNLNKKLRSNNFGSEMNSEVKHTTKHKKKRKKESTSCLEIPKEFLSCLLQSLLHSTINLPQSLYRKLLHHLFEYLMVIEEKSKHLFSNRNLILNYLELLFKLLIRKNLIIEDYPMKSILGKPNIFPLKLKLTKFANIKKTSLLKFDKKFSTKTKNTLFNNRKHSNHILLIFRKIAQKAQGLLGFDIEDTMNRMISDKTYQSQSKKST